MIAVLAVALGAATGAVLRSVAERAQAALLVRARARRPELTHPADDGSPVWWFGPGWSTLAVNVLGSAVLGWAAARWSAGLLDEAWFWALGSGLAGGLSTFSTLGVELDDARRERRTARLVVLAGLQVVLGLASATIGYQLAV